MYPPHDKTQFQVNPAHFVEKEIKELVRTSPLNHLSLLGNRLIFDDPLVQFADGDDSIFTEYKSIIDPSHLTPREAMAKAFNQNPGDSPEHVSIISWILPITGKTRESNRRRTLTPSHLWAYTRFYGEQFNEAIREHVVKLITDMGHLAAAPAVQPYFDRSKSNRRGRFSNWSERHIAYAAGLGTFSLSDGFITERGIAHRCGSVVTDLWLPASPRTGNGPFSNCLFYANNSCRACIKRCPSGAITENGHDKIKCYEYVHVTLLPTTKKYGVPYGGGCGLCQTKVPCEFRNPVKKLN